MSNWIEQKTKRNEREKVVKKINFCCAVSSSNVFKQFVIFYSFVKSKWDSQLLFIALGFSVLVWRCWGSMFLNHFETCNEYSNLWIFFLNIFSFASASLSSCSSHSIYLESLKFLKIPFSLVQLHTHLFWVCLAIESLAKFEREKQQQCTRHWRKRRCLPFLYVSLCVSRFSTE